MTYSLQLKYDGNVKFLREQNLDKINENKLINIYIIESG